MNKRLTKKQPLLFAGQTCYSNETVRTQLLHFFVNKPLQFFSLKLIAQKTGLSQDLVVETIQSLTEDGIRIPSRPLLDYAYEPAESLLHADVIAAHLNTQWWGKKVYVGQNLTSTIDVAKEIVHQPSAHGALIVANHQQRGRGRQGHSWISQKGNDILITFIITLTDWTPSSSLLSLFAATAAARVLESAYNILVTIKWPNDLLVEGKKVGGVLVERLYSPPTVLVSLGLNVHSQPHHWPLELRSRVTSLSMLKQEEWQRDVLIAQCGTTWEALWETTLHDRGETVRGYWKQYASTLGKRVQLVYRGAVMAGRVYDIDEEGRLLFRSDDGSTRAFFAEEVHSLRFES